MSNEYFVRRDGKVSGPHSLAMIRKSLEEKKLKANDLLSLSSDGPWERVAAVHKEIRAGRPFFNQGANANKPTETPQSKPQEEGQEDWLGAIDELVEDEKLLPPLKVVRPKNKTEKHKASKEAENDERLTKNLTIMLAWVRGGLVAVFIVVGVVFAIPHLKKLGDLTASTTQDSDVDTNPVSDGSNVKNPLKKLGRLLRLNKKERENLESSIRQIESNLVQSERTSNTVFQQQVGRTQSCIEMTAIVAEALGAEASDTRAIMSKRSQNDSSSKNVFQQLAGQLSVYLEIMTLAARQSGVSSRDISTCLESAGLNDRAAKNVNQQIAGRADAVQEMARLLAGKLGASRDRLSSISDSASSSDRNAETVYQQMSARQAGIVRFLGAAAVAQGAERSDVAEIEAKMASDDRGGGITAPQQFAARINRAFQMTAVLAKAIVVK